MLLLILMWCVRICFKKHIHLIFVLRLYSVLNRNVIHEFIPSFSNNHRFIVLYVILLYLTIFWINLSIYCIWAFWAKYVSLAVFKRKTGETRLIFFPCKINLFWYSLTLFNARWCQVTDRSWAVETKVSRHWRCEECYCLTWLGCCYRITERIAVRCP